MKKEKLLNSTFDNEKNKIQEIIDNFNTSPCYVSDATSSFEIQLIDVKKSFDLLSMELKKDLEQTKKNLSKFSITLFGRTRAGKSTLMEILTWAGNSIGLGA